MVNLEESLPIYIRINEGIKDAILNGEVKEGQQIATRLKNVLAVIF